jgi:hypothetical protein
MHWLYKNRIQRYLNDLKKNQEPSKIQEDEFCGDYIERTLKRPGNSMERFNNLKKIYIMTPPKNLFHVMMFLYLLHQVHQWI